jgi:hypothetical protein
LEFPNKATQFWLYSPIQRGRNEALRDTKQNKPAERRACEGEINEPEPRVMAEEKIEVDTREENFLDLTKTHKITLK